MPRGPGGARQPTSADLRRSPPTSTDLHRPLRASDVSTRPARRSPSPGREAHASRRLAHPGTPPLPNYRMAMVHVTPPPAVRKKQCPSQERLHREAKAKQRRLFPRVGADAGVDPTRASRCAVPGRPLTSPGPRPPFGRSGPFGPFGPFG